MSYGGRIHDALWQSLEDKFPNIDWEIRSEIIEEMIRVLPTFEEEVQQWGINRAGWAIEKFLKANA